MCVNNLPKVVTWQRHVCPLDYSRSYEWILINYFVGVGRAARNSCLDFGGGPGHDVDPGFLGLEQFDLWNFLKDYLFTVAIPTDSQE